MLELKSTFKVMWQSVTKYEQQQQQQKTKKDEDLKEKGGKGLI